MKTNEIGEDVCDGCGGKLADAFITTYWTRNHHPFDIVPTAFESDEFFFCKLDCLASWSAGKMHELDASA